MNDAITLTDEQKKLLVELHAQRAKLTNPFDRVVFDNMRHPKFPTLVVGLWLMAFPESKCNVDE